MKNIFKKSQKPTSQDNQVEKKSILSKVTSLANSNKTLKKTGDFATDKFVKAVEKEKEISKKLAFWTMFYQVFMMVSYTAFTIITVFAKWKESNHPLLVAIMLALYFTAFAVLIYFNIKQTKNEQMTYDKKVDTIKNYKSISVLFKKILKLFGILLSISIAVESWQKGLIFQVISSAFILISILSAIMGIRKEVKKIKKRNGKKQSNIFKAKKAVEDYSDNLKAKRNKEKSIDIDAEEK